MSKRQSKKKGHFTEEELDALDEYNEQALATPSLKIPALTLIDIKPLLHAINDGISAGGTCTEAFKILRSNKNNPLGINHLANQLVIFKSILDLETGVKEIEFLTNHDISTNPPLVQGRALHICGAVSY